jgi:hypothetical protein
MNGVFKVCMDAGIYSIAFKFVMGEKILWL